jgi:hypothetical protein
VIAAGLAHHPYGWTAIIATIQGGGQGGFGHAWFSS